MRVGDAIQPWDVSALSADARRLTAIGDERTQIEKAAKGFELILARTWLASVRNASIEPQSELTSGYRTLADDQLAAHFVNQGGFGLASSLVEQMMKQVELRKQAVAASETAK